MKSPRRELLEFLLGCAVLALLYWLSVEFPLGPPDTSDQSVEKTVLMNTGVPAVTAPGWMVPSGRRTM